MKLRIKQDSIRLRITRSELVRLQAGESIQESVQFAPAVESILRYVLKFTEQVQPIAATFVSQQITVTISPQQLATWSAEDQVGAYACLPIIGETALSIALEKDFACLDRSDEDNTDTFANPLAGTIC